MIDIPNVKRVLVDARNLYSLLPKLILQAETCQLMGFDIETEDSQRHDGLNQLMNIDEDGARKGKKLIFDTNRTVVTGFSTYFDGDDTAYYFNLAHADIDNRLEFREVQPLLDAFKGYYVIHNAPFEIVMMSKALNVGYNLPHGRVLDSLILCVTAYNSDTYPKHALGQLQLSGLFKLLPDIHSAYARRDDDAKKDLINKFCAKESDAKHSYNGLISEISYGFGLKKAVKSWLGYQQKTFDEVIGDKPHMGALTGAEVVSYGADDAICCLALYHTVLAWMIANNPEAVSTYFKQENPCCWVYAQMNATGLRVDIDAIYKAQDEQRELYAVKIREMQNLLAQALAENREEHPSLEKYSPWYVKNKDKYKDQIVAFTKATSDDDYDLVNNSVRSPVGKGWSGNEPAVLNLSYYMGKRAILFGTLGLKPRLEAGKIQSDSEACVALKEKALKEADTLAAVVLETYEIIAAIEQALKLFVTNFIRMTDPDTGRMYPTVSSLLDTRRIAMSNPNTMQLSKMGPSKFVRAFFLPDEDDHVILAPDFSAIELVILAGYSNDANFIEAYAQRPHRDLHSQTGALMGGYTLEEFNSLPNKKELRKQAKIFNFSYWYSGSLRTAGGLLGWEDSKVYEMTDIYKAGFPEAEQWRLATIAEAKVHGLVKLPDGLVRYRYEATQEWFNVMLAKFDRLGVSEFGRDCLRRIQNRASNQVVNAKIQGLCATYIKRKMQRAMFEDIPRLGFRARVMFPCHDEVVCSVHKDDLLKFKEYMYALMIDSEGIFENVKIDSSLAMGRNYLAFDPIKNPKGLVELMEIDKNVQTVDESRWGARATEEETQAILDYLFT